MVATRSRHALGPRRPATGRTHHSTVAARRRQALRPRRPATGRTHHSTVAARRRQALRPRRPATGRTHYSTVAARRRQALCPWPRRQARLLQSTRIQNPRRHSAWPPRSTSERAGRSPVQDGPSTACCRADDFAPTTSRTVRAGRFLCATLYVAGDLAQRGSSWLGGGATVDRPLASSDGPVYLARNVGTECCRLLIASRTGSHGRPSRFTRPNGSRDEGHRARGTRPPSRRMSGPLSHREPAARAPDEAGRH